MSILARKANSFIAVVAFSADIFIGLRRLSFLFRKSKCQRLSGKKKLCLQEALDLLLNLLSEINNILTDDFSDEVPAYCLLEFPLDSQDNDQETELKRILFSDEAHFWLNGSVNKQNCRIWSEANPQVYVETPLHPEKLTVWCALWAGGILLQKR
ncbi:hypothetical protein TNCV_3096151 [Trichonephila clavipes]|nr:hypothetical protein TNCV_3096151 [Trichonephila clavipes]